MSLTTDPTDPRLGHGADPPGVRREQNALYLVLPEGERAKGFVRPVRTSYVHVGPPVGKGCGSVTTMGRALAETYARQPSFYGATYCCACARHAPVAEFVWVGADGRPTADRVGT